MNFISFAVLTIYKFQSELQVALPSRQHESKTRKTQSADRNSKVEPNFTYNFGDYLVIYITKWKDRTVGGKKAISKKCNVKAQMCL